MPMAQHPMIGTDEDGRLLIDWIFRRSVWLKLWRPIGTTGTSEAVPCGRSARSWAVVYSAVLECLVSGVIALRRSNIAHHRRSRSVVTFHDGMQPLPRRRSRSPPGHHIVDNGATRSGSANYLQRRSRSRDRTAIHRLPHPYSCLRRHSCHRHHAEMCASPAGSCVPH